MGEGKFSSPILFFYGSIAQLARAADSYPAGCWFDSDCCYQIYGDALVSTGASKYYETSTKKNKINGNILSKVANKVKSLFSFNSVVYA